jgi:hypothetical protein
MAAVFVAISSNAKTNVKENETLSKVVGQMSKKPTYFSS